MSANPLLNIGKILIVQFRPYGDVLLATVYLESLHRRYPHARIDFLVSEPYDDIVRENPFVSNVLVAPAKGTLRYFTGRARVLMRVITEKYDLIIDQANGAGARPFLLLGGARYRLGWDRGRSHALYNLRAPRGIGERPGRMFYRVTPASAAYVEQWLAKHALADKAFICVSPGSAAARKRWDTSAFVTLTHLIARDTGLPAIISGVPAGLAEFKAAFVKPPAGIFYGPPTTFNELAALITRCRMLVCVEGGVNHLSVATGTPTVAIFGPTSVSHWSPQGAFPHHYHVHNPRWTDSHDRSFGVTPERVLGTVRRLLDELESAPANAQFENAARG